MTKTFRPALLLAFVLLAAVLLGAALPCPALSARPSSITKALDYTHARQATSGGFTDAGQSGSQSITPWAILAIVAGKENPAKWDKSGKDPIDFIQSLSLTSTATSSMNPPAYYAKTILALVASDRQELIWAAGTPRIDLLAKLLTYRDESDGHFSLATSGDRRAADVSTTTWALLALVAADQSSQGDLVVQARDWLAATQKEDGGWGFQSGTQSSVDQTAATIQALAAGGVGVSNTGVLKGMGFLKAAQRNDGGFGQYLSDVRSNAESTAWTVQAIEATRGDPSSWTKGGKSPLEYLRSLQKADGSFAHSKGATGRSVMMSTTQSLIALAGKAFPFTLADAPIAPAYLPKITSFKPGNGAVFSSTNDVTVTAEYADTKGGTGIRTDAVRILIDGANKTSKARVYSSKIYLKLVDLPYGQHTIEIRVADKAGNSRSARHTVTVSYYPSSGGSGSGSGSGSGGTYVPPTYPRSTPTPRTTLYPTPGASATATPAPFPSGTGAVTGTAITSSGSPSPSASASAAGQSDGGGGSAGLLGVTLLAMLPLGAGLSYWLHRRHATALANAGRGKLLPGGGTPWKRFKGHLPGTS